MIELNGKKFAKNNKEFTESLFHKGGTCTGFYRKTKNKIILEDSNHNEIGVINRYGVLASVNIINGKKYYSYCKPKLIGSWDSITKEFAEIEQVYLNVMNKRILYS